MEGVRYEHLLGGLAGGLLSSLALHPLDMIRIRFSGAVLHGSKQSGACRAVLVSEKVVLICSKQPFTLLV